MTKKSEPNTSAAGRPFIAYDPPLYELSERDVEEVQNAQLAKDEAEDRRRHPQDYEPGVTEAERQARRTHRATRGRR